MNTKTNAVTGEGTVSREEIEQGTYDELMAKDERRLGLAWPSFEDIQAMAGFPVDSEGRALVVDEEENDDDTRTIGLPSNEEAEADDSEADDIEERETPYRLRDEGRSYSGEGESYAERNA
jgi:hypothetical protein